MKIRIDSVIFSSLPDVSEICDFLINFPEKCHFQFFYGAKHHKNQHHTP